MEIQFIVDNRNVLIDILGTMDLYLGLAYELIGLQIHTLDKHIKLGLLTHGRLYAKYQYINYLLVLLIDNLWRCESRVSDKQTLFTTLLNLTHKHNGVHVRPIEDQFVIW